MDYCIGQILLLPYTFAPQDLLLCDGRTMNVSGNEALYSLLGTTYGGNGTTNFCLPNLQGTEPINGLKYYIVVTGGDYPQRQ